MDKQLEVIEGKVFDIIGVPDAAIAQMAREYMPLKITDINNKDEYRLVHDARMVVKTTRVKVEKKRKEMTADAVTFQQKVNAEARRLTGLMEPIETHLLAEEKKVDDAIAEAKEKVARELEERTQRRAKALTDYGMNWDGKNYFLLDISIPYEIMRDATEDQFSEFARKVAEAAMKEQKRVADEKSAMEAERKRLEAQAAEQEKIAQVQREKEEAIKAEQEAIAREKQKAIDDAESAEIEKRRKVAEEAAIEQAKKDAAALALRREEEKRLIAEAKKKDAEEKARKKAERAPDKIKIGLWIKAINEISYPTLKTAEAIEVFDAALQALASTLHQLSVSLDEL